MTQYNFMAGYSLKPFNEFPWHEGEKCPSNCPSTL